MSRPHRRLLIEILEARTLLAVVIWKGNESASGDWFDQNNWVAGRLPTSEDDVVIATEGAAVNFAGGGGKETSVNSLYCTGKLVVSEGTLRANGTMKVFDLELSGGNLFAEDKLSLLNRCTWESGSLSSNAVIDFLGFTQAIGKGQKLFDSPAINNYGVWVWNQGIIDGPDNWAFVNRRGAICIFNGGRTFDLPGENHGLWVFNTRSDQNNPFDKTPGNVTMKGLTNSGDVTLQLGTLTTPTFRQVTGSLLMAGGSLNPEVSILLYGGTLLGGGTIFGSLFNYGARIAPGASPLSILGDFVQGPGGTLEVSVSGPAAAKKFDRLRVFGTTTLGGRLDVLVLPPSLGENDEYFVVRSTSLTGEFSNAAPVDAGALTLFPRLGPSSFVLIALGTEEDTNDSRLLSGQRQNGHSPDAVDEVGHTLANLGAKLADAALSADPTRYLIAAVRNVGAMLSGGNRLADSVGLAGDPGASGLGRMAALGLDRGSGRGADLGGSDDPLPGSLQVTLPALELPPDEEALVAADLAKAMLVGGRSRSTLLPQGGSPSSVIATQLSGDDTQAGLTEARSDFTDLFILPLPRPNSGRDADKAPKEEEETEGVWTAGDFGLPLAIFGGMALWLSEQRQRKLCSVLGKVPARTSRQ